jgi:hypothetical protein
VINLLLVIIYFVFLYLKIVVTGGPSVNPKPIRTKTKTTRIPNPEFSTVAPNGGDIISHIANIQKLSHSNPKADTASPLSMKGALTGLPLQMTFSSFSRYLLDSNECTLSVQHACHCSIARLFRQNKTCEV